MRLSGCIGCLLVLITVVIVAAIIAVSVAGWQPGKEFHHGRSTPNGSWEEPYEKDEPHATMFDNRRESFELEQLIES